MKNLKLTKLSANELSNSTLTNIKGGYGGANVQVGPLPLAGMVVINPNPILPPGDEPIGKIPQG